MRRRGVRCSVLAILCAIFFLPVAGSAQESPPAASATQYPEGLVHTAGVAAPPPPRAAPPPFGKESQRPTLSITPDEFVRAGEFTPERPKGIGSIRSGGQAKVGFSGGDQAFFAC